MDQLQKDQAADCTFHRQRLLEVNSVCSVLKLERGMSVCKQFGPRFKACCKMFTDTP